MTNKTGTDDKLIIMNRQLFNKKETIILPEESQDVPYSPVKESVLAGMLASFEKLGYKFSYNDIRKMAIMSEERLTEQVYLPLLDVLKEAKGMDVEHHILFPDPHKSLTLIHFPAFGSCHILQPYMMNISLKLMRFLIIL